MSPQLDFILKDLAILLEILSSSEIRGRVSKSRVILRKPIKCSHTRKYPTYFQKCSFYFQDDVTSSYPQGYVGAEAKNIKNIQLDLASMDTPSVFLRSLYFWQHREAISWSGATKADCAGVGSPHRRTHPDPYLSQERTHLKSLFECCPQQV